MRSSVIIFPGSNCDRDMDVALKKYGFKNHMIWHNDITLPKCDLVVLPGGFSYGDYLRCGSIAGKSKIIQSVIDFAKSGGLVLGICNGFQILTETGLLPGVLQQNKYLNFICRNVHVKVNDKKNKYFKDISKDILELHIAHNECNYFCSEEELKVIEDNNQIALTYCNSDGSNNNDSNPNGALKNIAGIFNKEKNVLGICNGFQILTETGLLPGVLQQTKFLNFICRNVHVKINDKDNKYFKNIKKDILELHIAHNEGNYFCSDEELKVINENNQVALTYCSIDGADNEEFNPNGAIKNIAGVFNKNKNVLGMMPHPERMIDKYLSGEDGSIFFENIFKINN